MPIIIQHSSEAFYRGIGRNPQGEWSGKSLLKSRLQNGPVSPLCILLAKASKKQKQNNSPDSKCGEIVSTYWVKELKIHSTEDMNSWNDETLLAVLQLTYHSLPFGHNYVHPSHNLSSLSLSQDLHKSHLIMESHWKSRILWFPSSLDVASYSPDTMK